MKRFLPITTELSLIREKHRVLLQYLRLTPGETLSCSAALSKKDLRRARSELPDGVESADFENDLGQVAWSRSDNEIQLRFLEEGHLLVELILNGPELLRWNEAMTELSPGS